MRWSRFSTRILGFFLLAAVAGCTGSDTSPGGVLNVDESVEFYFGSGATSYSTLRAESLPKLLSDAAWETPRHIDVESPVVEIVPKKVSWQVTNGNRRTTYTVDGYKVHVKGRLKIGLNAEPGQRTVSLKLPAVDYAAIATSTIPFVKTKHTGTFTGGLALKSFTVHASAAGHQWAVVWKTTLAVVGGLLLLALLAFTQSGRN